MQRAWQRGAAALEQAKRQSVACTAFERKAQDGRRGFPRLPAGAENEGAAGVPLGRDGEPAQAGILGAREPDEKRPAESAAQSLLGRPERLALGPRPEDHEAVQPQAASGESGGVRQMRRRHPKDDFSGAAQTDQGGQNERELARPAHVDEDFDERS